MRWPLTILQLLAVWASLFNVICFRLDNLLLERAAELDRLTLATLAVAAALTAAVLVLCWRGTVLSLPRAGLAVLLVVLTALSGFVPGIIESHIRAAEHVARKAEQQDRDQAFARELLQWTTDIDRRVAAAHPLEPEQAWALLDCVTSAGYRDDGAAPPSAQALDLLRRALAARLIDVNATVPGHRLKDPTSRPLFLQFYKERVEPLRYALARQDWEIMRLLATNDADLSLPAAAPLIADLEKTVVPGPSRFVSLR
jgi:hypothetical protein